MLIAPIIAFSIWVIATIIDPIKYLNVKASVICCSLGTLLWNIVLSL